MRLLKHRHQKREPAKLDITAFMNLMIVLEPEIHHQRSRAAGSRATRRGGRLRRP
jgi:hypothetical protein